MRVRRPPVLRNGDCVALLAPAGPARSPEEVESVREALRQLGFRVRLGKSVLKRSDYLAGSDADRARDLNRAWADPAIRAVFCLRGGYGSGRLLSLLDFDALSRSPKLFAGFSDLTSLHGAILRRCGVATLHGPTAVSAFVGRKVTPAAARTFEWLAGATDALGSYAQAMKWTDPVTIRKGKAAGRLVGGNLTVFCTLLGTPFLPKPQGKILFLEDVGEEPYRLDRMLNHLRQAGYLAQLQGILLGKFSRCHSRHPGREAPGVVLERCLRDFPIPVLANFPAGHCRHHASLPLGCRVELDADNGDVVALESLCVAG
ncbi:LD-carboxypeptidase [Candidatus Poribacteria bacterium]|nr:LD-carboxypeptidase [Candidatus Poribacteria bacterium]